MNLNASNLNIRHALQNSKPFHAIVLLAGILGLVLVGIFHTLPPTSTKTKDSPQASFSASHAMPHVRKIAASPHPTGSNENAQVRQYLVEQLKILGLNPEIQSALVINPQSQEIANVHNVLVRIPGTATGAATGKALLLAAHYDSVPTGPGAADDGASVAAMLEVLRLLKTQAPLQNDLICLFSDAEEMGLLGAQAFVEQHPWAKTVGLALNFEYRGNRGAFMMFETSQGNGKLIAGLAQAAPTLMANSLMYEVYKHLPNDTDMSLFKRAGIAGMNFAAIDGHASYHTQLDSPDFLDQDTLQQEGDLMLALATHFGNVPLVGLQAEDCVYFDVPGLGLVNYPVSWAIPLNCLLILLFSLVIALGIKAKALQVTRVMAGMMVFALMLAGLAATSHLLWMGICQLYPEYDTFIQGDTYNSQWYLLGLLLLNIAAFAFLQRLVCRWLWDTEFIAGVMLVWLGLLLFASFWLPGASFLFFWPLAAMLVGMGLLFKTPASLQPANGLVLFLAISPGILLFTPFIKGLFIGLTPQMIAAVAVFLLLILGLLTPLLVVVGHRKGLVYSSLTLGLLALLAGSLTSGFDNEHPRQNTLIYALDSSSQQAFWLSTDKQTDEWTTTFFPNVRAQRQFPELFGNNFPAMWASSAPALELPAPTIETLADATMAGVRQITLRIKSTRHAPKLSVSIEGIDVLQANLNGQKVTQTPRQHWHVDGYGLNEEGLLLELAVKAGAPFTVRALDFTYALPALASPRPSSMMAKPTEFSDNTIVAAAKKL